MQAIDPRTRMVLFKMLNRGVFYNINGCISTGKEVTCNFQDAVHILLAWLPLFANFTSYAD